MSADSGDEFNRLHDLVCPINLPAGIVTLVTLPYLIINGPGVIGYGGPVVYLATLPLIILADWLDGQSMTDRPEEAEENPAESGWIELAAFLGAGYLTLSVFLSLAWRLQDDGWHWIVPAVCVFLALSNTAWALYHSYRIWVSEPLAVGPDGVIEG